jgi:acyl-ACP thioesterase
VTRSPAADELIAVPTDGRVYALEMRPGLGDCAPSGRIRLDALARWLQDVAYADVEDAGVADAAVWVLRRTRIRASRWPRFGERMVVRTFCSGIGRMWAERRTTIAPVDVTGIAAPSATTAAPADASGIVEAVALWVHLDPTSWRPTPLTAGEIEVYGGTGADRRVHSRLHHPKPEQIDARSEWTFRATDLDIADHVNNAAYWGPLEEELLATAEPAAIDAEIEFRTPAQPGLKRILAAGPIGPGARRWILAPDDELHASIVLNATT